MHAANVCCTLRNVRLVCITPSTHTPTRILVYMSVLTCNMQHAATFLTMAAATLVAQNFLNRLRLFAHKSILINLNLLPAHEDRFQPAVSFTLQRSFPGSSASRPCDSRANMNDCCRKMLAVVQKVSFSLPPLHTCHIVLHGVDVL